MLFHRKKLVRHAVAALVLGGAMAVPLIDQQAAAAPSGKAVPSTSASGRPDLSPAFWAEQEVLDAAADAITPVLKTDPNYTGVFVDAAHNRLVGYGIAPFHAVTWSRAIAMLPRGSRLDYGKSMLTDQQVNDQTAYVSARSKHGLQARSWGLSALDGPYEVSMAPGHSLEPGDVAYLHRHGANTLHVATDTTKPLGRFDDTPPFFGGSYIAGTTLNGKYWVCSSGFMTRSNVNGGLYVITADHCINWADPREWVGSNSPNMFLGSATSQDTGTDSAYIKVTNYGDSAVAPYIYDGPYGQDGHAIPIIGAATNHVGDYVCGSGAASRQNCTWVLYPLETVSNKNEYNPSQTYNSVDWAAYQRSQSYSSMDGDSGGPVFSYTSSYATGWARGIISAGADPMSCPSWAANHTCMHKTYFTDVNSIIANRNLDITP